MSLSILIEELDSEITHTSLKILVQAYALIRYSF